MTPEDCFKSGESRFNTPRFGDSLLRSGLLFGIALRFRKEPSGYAARFAQSERIGCSAEAPNQKILSIERASAEQFSGPT